MNGHPAAPAPLPPTPPEQAPGVRLSPEGHDPHSPERVRIEGPLRRLLLWYGLGTLGLWLTVGAVNAVLLPLQLESMDEGRKAVNLGIVTAVGAIVGMVTQPIAGLLSDRTRSRRGRRAPWLLCGAGVAATALGVLGWMNALAAVIVTYAVLQVGLNLALGPKTAIMPDRVPRGVRGVFSAASGLGVLLGVLGGQVLAVAFADAIVMGYAALAFVLLLTVVGLAVRNPDHDSTDDQHTPLRLSAVLGTLGVNPRRHPDFAWGFLGRLLVLVGFYLANSFQLFILQDHIGLGDDAVSRLPVFAGIALLATVVSTLVGGPLSDRMGRRKPVAVGAGLLIAAALVAPWVMPTTTGFAIYAVLAGLGFGAYLAVDQALLTEVLPDTADSGRYLGVLNIAAAFPAAVAAALAGTIVNLWGYEAIFPVGMAAAILGSLAILPIRSVR